MSTCSFFNTLAQINADYDCVGVMHKQTEEDPNQTLAFTTFWANQIADAKLMIFFLFFPHTGFEILTPVFCEK